MKDLRDRIVRFERVPAEALRANPQNWRRHPAAQRAALEGILREVGIADALLARQLPDGSLELIDGHLRAQTVADVQLPVLVLDLDDAEAEKLLAVLDPLASLATADDRLLAELVGRVETDDEGLRTLLAGLVAAGQGSAEAPPAPSRGQGPDPTTELYQVVVECRDEAQQREVFERLTAEGFACRLLVL